MNDLDRDAPRGTMTERFFAKTREELETLRIWAESTGLGCVICELVEPAWFKNQPYHYSMDVGPIKLADKPLFDAVDNAAEMFGYDLREEGFFRVEREIKEDGSNEKRRVCMRKQKVCERKQKVRA